MTMSYAFSLSMSLTFLSKESVSYVIRFTTVPYEHANSRPHVKASKLNDFDCDNSKNF